MRIQIATPAEKGSKKGNRVAALRWARMLSELGHRVDVNTDDEADLLIAMHARKTSRAIEAFSAAHPKRPIVVVLTGTDLYGDVPKRDPRALASIRTADRLVVLQPHALEVLAKRAAKKARVILQSVPTPQTKVRPRVRTFDICVVGHMRDVKDPMRAAMAARKLPASSRIALLHAGGAIQRRFEKLAVAEMDRNARYRWLGEVTRAQSRRLIQRSRALVVSSQMEGGAHATSEALVAGTPVLASRISGNIGMLGEDYPALFEVGDTAALTALMHRFETDAQFRDRLALWCHLLAPAYTPERELFALRSLIAEVS